ncbi:Crp/Fnr family transcriptional regulator [Mycolicibacterium sp.]|uniref:Crp/Fnr family transcriptional regulator n=1 Tax=Mycolicibacterium sp. TaxID=2320850 RepID=UPI003D0B8114
MLKEVDPGLGGTPSTFLGVAAAQLFAGTDARWIEFPSGGVIFSEGDVDTRLYIVETGKVKIGRHNTCGREYLFTVAGPGEMFGEESALDGGPRNSCATAMTDVRALAVTGQSVLSLAVTDTEVAQRLMRVLARRIRWTSDNITDAVYADVTARVAKQLLGLAQRFGVAQDGALRVPMELTQEQFAHLVGTSRESVNKALCEFADRGWIVIGKDAVLIRDSEPLAARMRGARCPGRPRRKAGGDAH